MEIRSVAQLNSVIDPFIKKGIENITEIVKKMLKDYIENNWYNAYSPSNYVRTFQFLNSVSVKKGTGKNEYVVYFDTSLINANEQSAGDWNQHMGTIGSRYGEDFDDMDFIKEIEIYGNFIHGHNKPLRSIDNTKNKIETDDLIEIELAKYLTSKGFKVGKKIT